MRIFLIVLDSVGIGEAPDAADYGDAGCATLQHCAGAVGGLRLPALASLGLGNIPALIDRAPIPGVPPAPAPRGSWGAMREVSQGKDTITGHWEIAGLELNPGFHLFPDTYPSFPVEITDAFVERTGRGILGNRHGSGTAIVEEMGARALAEGKFIVYTSADSVFQIAAHTDVVPLPELYAACEVARELCDPYRVGRVIARPFDGPPDDLRRTKDRVDYAFKPNEPTLLERLHDAEVPVYSVGKIEDIFAHRGITKGWHTGENASSQAAVSELIRDLDRGFVFANFIDFDMVYGHRRDAEGYAACLERCDAWLSEQLDGLRPDDLLVITADHGNDPTFKGTDHTREYVPLLVHGPTHTPQPLGVRQGFFDLAQGIAARFGIDPMPRGRAW